MNRGGMAEKNAARQGRGENANSGGLGDTKGGGPSTRPNNGTSAVARDRARQAMTGRSVAGPTSRQARSVTTVDHLTGKAQRGTLTSEEHDLMGGFVDGTQAGVAANTFGGMISKAATGLLDTVAAVPGVKQGVSLASKGLQSLGVSSANPSSTSANPAASNLGYGMGVANGTPGIGTQAASAVGGLLAGPVGAMAPAQAHNMQAMAKANDVAQAIGRDTGTPTNGNPGNGGQKQGTTLASAKQNARSALTSAPQVTATQNNQAPDLSGMDFSGGLTSARNALKA